jgi:BirA family biotin operon repressor/biotin-[acetyl-CoA-carboxylase] ligase
VGGLYLSWIAAGLADEIVASLPMLSAAAAFSAVSEVGAEGLGIKWPNDLVANGRKLAGLLVHARRTATVVVAVGLGLNIRPVDLPSGENLHPATCLDEVMGRKTPDALATEVTVQFVGRMVEYVGDPAAGLSVWREHLIHRVGEPIAVQLADGERLTGSFAGLTSEGFLRLQQGGAVRVISGGDVLEQSG